MSPSAVEFDFFGIERREKKSSNYKSQFKKFPFRRSFGDLQGAISKINPEIIKSVTACSLPSPINFPALPSKSGSENISETAPLTIFYKGNVTIFDVPKEKAVCILKLAVEGNSKAFESKDANVPSDQPQQLLETLNTGDLPIARRKSLQRFLEKRKERLTSMSPYSSHT